MERTPTGPAIASSSGSGGGGFEDMAGDDDIGEDTSGADGESGGDDGSENGGRVIDASNPTVDGADANGGVENWNPGSDDAGSLDSDAGSNGMDAYGVDSDAAVGAGSDDTHASDAAASDRLPPELAAREIPPSPVDYPLDAAANGYTEADRKKGRGFDVLGALIIPAIDFRETLVEGAGEAPIKRNIGRLGGSKDPGEQGQCVVTGHRYYDWGNMFNRLDELVVGDVVDVAAPDGTYYRYRVREVILSKPKPYDLFGSSEKYELTLVTCHPIHVSTHQLLVRCELETVVGSDGVVRQGA